MYIYIYIYVFFFKIIFAPYPWVGNAVGYWFFDTIAVTVLIRTLEKDYEEVGIETAENEGEEDREGYGDEF